MLGFCQVHGDVTRFLAVATLLSWAVLGATMLLAVRELRGGSYFLVSGVRGAGGARFAGVTSIDAVCRVPACLGLQASPRMAAPTIPWPSYATTTDDSSAPTTRSDSSSKPGATTPCACARRAAPISPATTGRSSRAPRIPASPPPAPWKVEADPKTGKASTASITNGKITAKVNRESWLSFYNEKGELLLEEYWRNRADITRYTGTLNLAGRDIYPILGGDWKITARFESKDGERFYGLGQYQDGYLDKEGHGPRTGAPQHAELGAVCALESRVRFPLEQPGCRA